MRLSQREGSVAQGSQLGAVDSPQSRRRIPVHISGLDGIRAVAATVVFLDHLDIWPLIPGAFAVGVFFFLSGFLITTLMMREHAENGRISIKEFYIRRSLRILPPMYIVLAIAAMLAGFGVSHARLDWVALSFPCIHFTNYYLVAHPGPNGLLPGLEVFWSLAVEEHFYLLFPLVFALCYGRIGPKRLAAVLAACSLALLVWRSALVFFFHTGSIRSGFSTDTRIDSIMWGCVMALWRNPALDDRLAQPIASAKCCVAACLGLAATFAYRNPVFRETARYTLQSLCLIPLFCAAVLRRDWLPVRLLDSPPLRWLGRVSYTFYLSHFMILEAFLCNGFSKAGAGAATLFCSLLFSQIMRVLVEVPLARVRRHHGGV